MTRADLADLAPLAPLAILAVTPLVVTVAISVRRHHALALVITLAGLAAAVAAVPAALAAAPATAGALVTVDALSLSFTLLIALGTAVVALMSRPYLARSERRPEEYYVLLGIAATGAAALVSTEHLAGVILAVETLSVALFGLIAYPRDRAGAIEAGLKYLIMTGAASAVLVFGAALLYADIGGLTFDDIAARASGGFSVVGLAGLALVIAGLAFKLALAPFHMWAPDVYQGAPAPVSALIATVSEGAVAALAFRMLSATGALTEPALAAIVAGLAVVSMAAGNLLALLQTRVKRLLAYSSVAHFGYLLVAVMAAGPLGVEALLFYVAAYFVMTYLAFGVVTALSGRAGDADALDHFKGLCWRRPVLGIALVLSSLSLLGVPVTAGFIAKLYVLAAGASEARWGLVVAIALTTAISAFYYLRLVVVSLSRPAEDPRGDDRSLEAAALLTVLVALLIALGVAPGILEPLATRAADALF